MMKHLEDKRYHKAGKKQARSKAHKTTKDKRRTDKKHQRQQTKKKIQKAKDE